MSDKEVEYLDEIIDFERKLARIADVCRPLCSPAVNTETHKLAADILKIIGEQE